MDQVSSKVIHDVSGQKKLISFNPIQGRITTQTVRDEEEYMEVSLDLSEFIHFVDLMRSFS